MPDPHAQQPSAPMPESTASSVLHPVGRLLDPLRLTIRAALRRMPAPLAEFILFGLKQAWASAFAGLMLGLLIGTKYVWHADWPIHRYDALFLAAVAIQIAFLALKLESLDEAKVAAFFTAIFLWIAENIGTATGTWLYPHQSSWQMVGVAKLGSWFLLLVVSFVLVAIVSPPRAPNGEA